MFLSHRHPKMTTNSQKEIFQGTVGVLLVIMIHIVVSYNV